MTCKVAIELMSAKLDGELTAEEQDELNRHLDQCGSCRALFEELTAIHDACSDLDAAPLPTLRENILKNLPAQEMPAAKQTGRVIPIHWRRWSAMAASFVLVALAAWYLPQTASVSPASSTPAKFGGTIQTANADLEDVQTIFTGLDDASNSIGVPSEPVPEPAAVAAVAPDDMEHQKMSVSGAASLPPVSDTTASSGAAVASDTGLAVYDEIELDAVSPESTPMVSAFSRMAGSSSEFDEAAYKSTRDLSESSLLTSVSASLQSVDGIAPLAAGSGEVEVSEPHPELAEGENVAAVLFKSSNVLFQRYCGVLTLQGGALLNDYPAQLQENGESWYELPPNAFYALINELTDTKVDFTLRVTGDDISSAAQIGLVVVLP